VHALTLQISPLNNKPTTSWRREEDVDLMNLLGLYWIKRCRLNEGIFVHFVQKKGMCMARGVTSISSDGTVGQKGVNCKFLQLSWVQLKQYKHWYQDCKLV
jgi:hypothetical protein